MTTQKAAEELMEIIRAALHAKETKQINSTSRGEFPVLKYLACHENEKVTPSDIASDNEISSARVAALLSVLEEKTLIIREIDKKDRRKIIVKLTENGRRHLRRLKTEMEEKIVKVLESMGETDTQEFLRTFKLFIRTLKEVNQ
ncbi:MAG: transcriptional regulator [Streptococcaceae bacterium]|jgi:DNA-binding MarR family transcriptional regulator|nr:transcriptional regulator [Streptococcaceae bacterium]